MAKEGDQLSPLIAWSVYLRSKESDESRLILGDSEIKQKDLRRWVQYFTGTVKVPVTTRVCLTEKTRS